MNTIDPSFVLENSSFAGLSDLEGGVGANDVRQVY